MSQAEHDPLASAILVTDSELLGNAVAAEIEMQLAALPRQEIAALSLANHGKIIIASDMETVIEMAKYISTGAFGGYDERAFCSAALSA